MSIKFQAFNLDFLGYSFSPKIVPTLLTLFVFPALIMLGLWQLDRADEKRVIDQGVNDAIAKPALLLNDADFSKIENEIYRSAKLNGEFDTEHQFLLDNRTNNGLPGYHVFTPFLLAKSSANNETQHAVLVNRGWIGYKGTRDQIVDIGLEKKTIKILGSIKNIPRSIVLQDQVKEESINTLVFRTENKQLEGVSLTQSIQLDKFESILSYKLLPVMIELDKSEKNGFIREWQPYFGSIDKHNAYAVQWFAMASIVLFLFLKLNIRKR